MGISDSPEDWLRRACAGYLFDLSGVFRRRGHHGWPVVANDETELEAALLNGRHLLALPREPAALANMLEVSLVVILLDAVTAAPGLSAPRGSEREYPDLELTGESVGDDLYAIDIKVARRATTKRGAPTGCTQSRITLYTGNTFFRYPTLHWPGTFRPFRDYAGHLDVPGIYTLNEDTSGRGRRPRTDSAASVEDRQQTAVIDDSRVSRRSPGH